MGWIILVRSISTSASAVETSDIAPQRVQRWVCSQSPWDNMVLAVFSLTFSFLDHTELLNSTNFQLIIVFNNVLGHKFLHRSIQSYLGFFAGIVSEVNAWDLFWPQRSFPSSLWQTSMPTIYPVSPVTLPISSQLPFTRASLRAFLSAVGLNFSTLCCK